MTRSMAETIALLDEETRAEVLKGVDMEDLQYDWTFWGRPEQIPPDDASWKVFAIVAGRGFGKTRAGAEWVHRIAMENPKCRIALVGRTAADVRDVIIQGESGLLGNHVRPEELPDYSPSNRKVTWPNGSMAQAFSAEEPAQLRGPQFHYAWADEAAAWKHTADDSGLNAWDNLYLATRLGKQPQLMVTTTPKRTKFMFDLLKDEADEEKRATPAKRVIITRGSTMENSGYLSEEYLDGILSIYEGTRLAKQELYGIMLEALDGALWSESTIADHRLDRSPGGRLLRVIAVDPSVAERQGDLCGIVVAEATPNRRPSDRHAYVIEDASLQAPPSEWAAKVVELFHRYRCPVVVEVNQGGALVKQAIHALDPRVPVLEVRATKGKALRAEPVTLKYDQGRVHHVGVLAELEAELTTWVPGERKSPDRLDALVYAIQSLLVTPPKQLGSGPVRATSFARRQIPGSGSSGAGGRYRR